MKVNSVSLMLLSEAMGSCPPIEYKL